MYKYAAYDALGEYRESSRLLPVLETSSTKIEM